MTEEYLRGLITEYVYDPIKVHLYVYADGRFTIAMLVNMEGAPSQVSRKEANLSDFSEEDDSAHIFLAGMIEELVLKIQKIIDDGEKHEQ